MKNDEMTIVKKYLVLLSTFLLLTITGIVWNRADKTNPLIFKQENEQYSSSPLKNLTNQEDIPEFDKDNPQAKGIILNFHQWPNEQDTAGILEYLRKADLKKIHEIERFKVWVFEWPDWRKALEAQEICNNLPDIPFLKYCEPDYLTGPAFVVGPSPPPKNELSPSNKEEQCHIDSIFKSDGAILSAYWAQEMIGSDLLKEELTKAPPPQKAHFVEVIDTTIEDHYIHVKNLISDEGEHSVLPEIGNQMHTSNILGASRVMIRSDNLLNTVDEKCAQHLNNQNLYEQCKADILPSFINYSMYTNPTDVDAFRALSPPAILVQAAGNVYTDELHFKYVGESAVRLSQDIDSIIVGSLNNNGVVSDFSQVHEEVHILAPSDDKIVTSDEKGNSIIFGGTSGAAPLVTGSLAGFEWLSGYHPTAQEAKLLLEKTAIPTLSSNEKPPLNGVGMLNSYKLGMVGKRLKEICETDVSCFKENIQKVETYAFPNNYSVLLEEVRLAFPECSSDMCQTESNLRCEDKLSVFKKLRQAAFLTPSNKELWRELACIYYSNGFTENVKGIMSFYKALLGAQMNSFVDKSCKTDTDCTLVPSCSEEAYYTRLTPCQQRMLQCEEGYAAEKEEERENCKKVQKEKYNCEIEDGIIINKIPAPPIGTLLPANKNYVSECQGPILCNNKCRCDHSDLNEKEVQCINSQCFVGLTGIIADSPAKEVPEGEAQGMAPKGPDSQINPDTSGEDTSAGGAVQ